MAADKICCVSGCTKSREDGYVLHKFPNPTKDPTRFCTWVQAVGGNLLCLDDIYVFKYRRICHTHFDSKYWTRSKMLSNIAIPTLHMKGLKVTKPKRTQISTKINVLKKKHKNMNIANEKYSKRLKKAMNLPENTTFLKAIKSFTSIATIFTMLQFRECGKHKMGRRFTPDEKVMALHFFKRGPRVYRMLQKIFVLPSPFTLSKMVSKANIKPGINENIFYQLKKQASKSLAFIDKVYTIYQ